ncbi:MAG: HAD family hydrolase [Symbiobacteriia bacterium]
MAGVLGARGWVGTPLAVENDCYTGRLAGPPCHGRHKVESVEALASDWGATVEWSSSYAYSDGWPDLPVLEKAGHAVAVDPDPRLMHVARERGWRVL